MRTAAVCLALTLAAPLSACIALHSNQPVQQQYLLSLPAQPASKAPAVGSAETLQVLVPVAAPGLASDGIAVLRPGHRLDYYTGGRWAVPAPMMLQTLVVEALRRQGRFSLVESDSGPFAARYLLNLELTHFEADYSGTADNAAGPTVRVSLVCTLGRREGRSLLTTLTVNSSVEAEADRMGAVIAAFQQATAAALGRVAREIGPAPAAPAAAVPAAPAADSAAPASDGR